MRARNLTLGLCLLVFLGCGNGIDPPPSIEGNWAFQVMGLDCPLPAGLLGPGTTENVAFSQTGSQLTAPAQSDSGGFVINFTGSYSGGYVSGMMTVDDGRRAITIVVNGAATAASPGAMVDGTLQILSDTAGECDGDLAEFWAHVSRSTQPVNSPPTVIFLQPADGTTAVAGSTITIVYRDDDPDDVALTSIYADIDGSLDTTEDRIPIALNRPDQNGATQTISWDTAQVQAGSYRIVAVSTDGVSTVTIAGSLVTIQEPQQPLLAFAGHGYSEDVDVINIETMDVVATIEGAGGYRMVLSRDGTKLYSTGGDENFYISDAVGYMLIRAFDPTDVIGDLSDELEAIAMSRDGSRVYFVDEQGYSGVYVLDTATDEVIAASSLFEDEPENAVVSPDGRYLYIADNSYALKVDLQTIEVMDRYEVGSDAHGIALSADGSKIYVKGVDGGIDVVDVDDMSRITTIETSNDGYYIELGGDGIHVYAVNEGTLLTAIDTRDESIREVTLTAGSARGVTTTPDGGTILVATSSGLIKLDAETLEETGFLQGSYQSVLVKAPTPVVDK